MSLTNPKRIEEYILRHLQNGPVLMLDLIEQIKKDRANTTKQAVYSAIRMLKKTEQLVTYKGTASLNLTWLNAMVNYFDVAKHNYIKGGVNENNFLDLDDKEKIKYYFQNSIKADIFWTHALYLLSERSQQSEPIFLYNPHEWFLLARNENELNFFKSVNEKGKRLFMTVGSKLFLDKYVQKYFDNDIRQYYAKEKPSFKENDYYLNIIGDFLIEVWLDKKTAGRIDEFYKDTAIWDESANEKLQSIVSAEGKVKMTISRNQRKAEKIKNSLKKYFVLG